ncbi:MAG: hypothetical protein A2Z24_01905 [Candidatus Woykebacteria bacterium RBG_16_44_10]|uniref:Antitoxin n=1 Tax=Candidatus Woykebacteria bacterium RBG_16_44_10 TaxID=1802597 RepID=A0A1G1WEK4_9BACT|nr:MAG: hypothetical protein A2Z24_01905 [Candidatus Woykebacteria bacterium RBG_16_44_10]
MNDFRKRITTNPNILTGKPTVAGTRIPVELILKKLAQNTSIDEILSDFPRLTRKDVQAAILYAEKLVEEQVTVH